jgi:hypothetical protein
MPRINDLNLNNWKEYQDIITDSLWIIGERDKSGTKEIITEILYLKYLIS